MNEITPCADSPVLCKIDSDDAVRFVEDEGLTLRPQPVVHRGAFTVTFPAGTVSTRLRSWCMGACTVYMTPARTFFVLRMPKPDKPVRTLQTFSQPSLHDCFDDLPDPFRDPRRPKI